MNEIKLTIPIVNQIGELSIPISGKLDSIILNCERIAITIASEYGYLIYDSKEQGGVSYIPIRTQSQDEEGHRINFSSDKFILNEKINIIIRSYLRNETEVQMIIRFEED